MSEADDGRGMSPLLAAFLGAIGVCVGGLGIAALISGEGSQELATVAVATPVVAEVQPPTAEPATQVAEPTPAAVEEPEPTPPASGWTVEEEAAIQTARYSIRRYIPEVSFPVIEDRAAYSVKDLENGFYKVTGRAEWRDGARNHIEQFQAVVNVQDPNAQFPLAIQVGEEVLLNLAAK